MSAYLGFWLFCLCIYDLVFLFCCLFVYFCVWFSHCCCFFLFCRNSTSFPVFPHITSGEQRNSKATPLQIGSQEYQINNHPNAKKHCKQFVELAIRERVMTTQAEFHFSWVYTFSATRRSTRQPSGSFNALASLHWLVFFLAEY